MNRSHLAALAIAVGVPTALGSTFSLRPEASPAQVADAPREERTFDAPLVAVLAPQDGAQLPDAEPLEHEELTPLGESPPPSDAPTSVYKPLPLKPASLEPLPSSILQRPRPAVPIDDATTTMTIVEGPSRRASLTLEAEPASPVRRRSNPIEVVAPERDPSFDGMPAPLPETVNDAMLTKQTQRLAGLLVQTSPENEEQRLRYRENIVGDLGILFDRRQERYDKEVAQLEEKVQSLKALIEKRQNARDEIIEKRLQQLMSEAEGLGW